MGPGLFFFIFKLLFLCMWFSVWWFYWYYPFVHSGHGWEVCAGPFKYTSQSYWVGYMATLFLITFSQPPLLGLFACKGKNWLKSLKFWMEAERICHNSLKKKGKRTAFLKKNFFFGKMGLMISPFFTSFKY